MSDFFAISPEMEAEWEALAKVFCAECRKAFADHYWAGDCDNDRKVNEALGAATTEFLEGMAAPVGEQQGNAPKAQK